MHLTLVIPTLNRYDRLRTMLKTVAASTVKPDQTIVIDNGGHLLDETHQVWLPDWVNVFTPPKNLGVAGSCNQAMRMSRDWWFHCNDDVELAPDLIEKMVAQFESDYGPHRASPLPDMYIPDYGVGSAFSVFMMDVESVISAVGWWDENFYPIYYEDNDYGYRMNLAGVKRKVVPGCQYIHHTSSSVNAMSRSDQAAHHENFRKLQAYYIEKWGDLPPNEKFTRPFDGASATTPDKSWWEKFGKEEI